MIRVTLKPTHRDTALDITLAQDDASDNGLYEFQCGDARHEVRIDAEGNGKGCIHLHGKTIPFYTVKQDNELAVWIDGQIHKLEVIDQTAQRGSAVAQQQSGNEIKAAMPGTILKINAQPGDAIEADQSIIIMESMKMEMSLTSPRKATIATITCQAGDMVSMGDVLATLTPQDDSHESA